MRKIIQTCVDGKNKELELLITSNKEDVFIEAVVVHDLTPDASNIKHTVLFVRNEDR